MQSIFSSAARLRGSMVGKKPGSRAGELKMYWTKPPRWCRRYGHWIGGRLAEERWRCSEEEFWERVSTQRAKICDEQSEKEAMRTAGKGVW